MAARISGPVMEEESSACAVGWNSPEEILNQLERVVGSVHFRNSKRYPALLRYLVEETLLGRMDCLKERVLGMEVFGRPPDYDTNADPIVRITAGEVRKRIAQYYQGADHEQELRLELPLGSYVPHFLPPHGSRHATQPSTTHRAIEPARPSPLLTSFEEAAQRLPVPQAALEIGVAGVPWTLSRPGLERAGTLPRWSRRTKMLFAFSLCGIIALGALVSLDVVNSRKQNAGLAFFWGPFLQSKETAMIVLGVHSFDIHGNDVSPVSFAQLPQGEQTALSSMIRSNMVPVSDVVSYSELVSLLTRQSVPFRTQSAAETSIEEFRRGPIILIGGFDNMWTMRLSSSLRFQFRADSDSLHEIRDSQHTGTRWLFDNAQSALSNSRDYAVVARFFDPQIEQHVLIVAGIGKSGTEAAAQFVTDKHELKTWVDGMPQEKLKNVEIVLATDVIEGKHGPAHVVASYRW